MKRKRQLIWWGAFLVVLVFSGCTKKVAENQAQPMAGETGKEVAQPESKNSFAGSLKDLLAKGESQECSWSMTSQETDAMNGVIYVDGERFFQEFILSGGPQGAMTGFMLNDGEWIYQWSSLTTAGTKISVEESEKMAEQKPETTEPPAGEQIKSQEDPGSVNWEEKMDYRCGGWKVDETKFQVPGDIVFTDLNQMLKSSQQKAQQISGDLCKMCENLPAEAKTDCLKNCAQ